MWCVLGCCQLHEAFRTKLAGNVKRVVLGGTDLALVDGTSTLRAAGVPESATFTVTIAPAAG